MKNKEMLVEYQMILAEILDILENGDAAEDFENVPYAATEIRMLADIIRGRLDNTEAVIECVECGIFDL